MIALTKRETSYLNQYTQTMYSNFYLMQNNGSGGEKIAAVRHALCQVSLQQRPGSKLSANTNATRMLLCKLVENYPDHTEDYIVSVLRAEDWQCPMFDALLPQYWRRSQNTGAGFWINRQFEHVINTLAGPMAPGRIVIMPRALLRSFIDVYTRQVDAAKRQPPLAARAETTVREMMAGEALMAGDMSQRKASAKDSAGTCFCCNAPKPRQVSCALCGYTPQKGSRS